MKTIKCCTLAVLTTFLLPPLSQTSRRITSCVLLLFSILAVVYIWQRMSNPVNTGGPQVPIPDSPGCNVQLLVELSQQTFLAGEPIYARATLLIQGSCQWQVVRTNAMRDFILIINRIDSRGNTVHMANEGTYQENIALGWAEITRHLMQTVDTQHPYSQAFSLDPWFDTAYTQSDMYDLSQPGTYTLQLIRLNPYAPHSVPSNVVTFRRVPAAVTPTPTLSTLWVTPTLPIDTPPPTPLALAKTRVPSLPVAISPTTAEHVAQLARWGKGTINAIAWSPDGRLLAVASPLGVYFYDAQTLTQVRFIETNVLVPSLAFSPDWSILAVGMPDDTIWLWRTSDGARIRTLGGPDVLRGHADWSPVTYRWPDQVPRLAFSPDGTMLASQSPFGTQGTIWLWRVSDGTLLGSLPGQVGGMLAFSPTSLEGNEGGTILASESEGGAVKLWRISTSDALATARLIRTLGQDVAGVSSFAFSPVTPGGDTGGMILAIGSINNIVRLWQTGDGVLLRTLESGERGGIGDVTFSPDGTILASAIGKTVQLWRVSDATRLHQLEGHTGSDISIAFSPDGTTLATGSTDDGTLRLWQVSDGALLRTMTGHTDYIACLVFSPDGRLLASSSGDGTTRLWGVVEE